MTKKYNIDKNNKKDSKVPDGGWGWIITFSSFMIGVLLGGVTFTFGLFLPHIRDRYGSTKGQVSWVSSVYNGTRLTIGPVSGVLVKTFGVRKVCICGSIIVAGALFLSTFSTNLEMLIIVYGVVGGFGAGLAYIPSIVVVGQYFDKRRAFATGITVCGTGIGALIFAPLSTYLIDKYTWERAQWIICGLVLNCVAFSGLYRPLPTGNLKGSKNKTPNSQLQCRQVQLQGRRPIIKTSEFDKGYYVSECRDKRRTSISSNIDSFINMKDTKENSNNVPTSNSKINFMKTVVSAFDLTLLSSPAFVIYGISVFLVSFAYFIPPVFLPNFAAIIGFSSAQQTMLVSAIGISGTVNRVLVGIVADRPWANSFVINTISLIVLGVHSLQTSGL